MSKPVQTDIRPWDTAVEMDHVTKTFEQWQRTGQGKNILRNLVKPQKKTVTALRDVSFRVKRGELLAYAGPNGAGKSTTMKLLAGMLLPVRGDIRVLGLSPHRDRIALMKRMGVLFGNRTELWWDHPVAMSFEWKRVVWDIPRERFEKTRDDLVDMLDMGDLMNTFARELSLGQRMRADIAMMLLHEPELVVLDEPTLGLDVLVKGRLIGFLRQLNRERGTTILVTSHDMDDLEQMARRILLISGGSIAFDGDFDELRKTVGSLRRVTIAAGPGRQPRLGCGRMVSGEDGIYEFEVDTAVTPVGTLLRELSAMEDIDDFEMKKAPVEQVIAELYGRWRQE